MFDSGIKTKAQYEWAVKRVEDLLPLVDDDTPADDPASIELELLSNMVADYSEAHFALGEPSLADVVKLRMYEMGLSKKALSELLEVSVSKVNSLLSGKSDPTFAMARNINRRLNVDARIVLGSAI